MQKTCLFLLAIAIVFLMPAFGAQSDEKHKITKTLQSMPKDEVIANLSDKTITTAPLTLPDEQTEPNSITISFGHDGQLKGEFTHKPSKDPQSDQGTWEVKHDGLLCAKWQHWNNGLENCVYTYATKNAILFIGADDYFNTLVFRKEIKPI